MGLSVYGSYVFIQNHLEYLFSVECNSAEAMMTRVAHDVRDYRNSIRLFFRISLFVWVLIAGYFVLTAFTDLHFYLWPMIPKEEMLAGIFLGMGLFYSRRVVLLSDALALTKPIEIIRSLRAFAIITVLFITSWFGKLTIYRCIVLIGSSYWLFFISSFYFTNKYFLARSNDILSVDEYSKTKEFFWKFCKPLIIYSVLSVLFDIFDRWFLQVQEGNLGQGVFGLSNYAAAAVILMIGAPVAQIFIREIAQAFKQNQKEKIKDFCERSTLFFVGLAAVPCLFLSFTAKPLLFLVSSGQIADNWLTMALMLLYPIHQVGNRLGISVTFAMHRTKETLFIFLCTRPFGMFLTYLFLASQDGVISGFALGSFGLALKTVILQYVSTYFCFALNARSVGFSIYKYFYKETLLLFILACGAFLSSLPSHYILRNDPSFIELFASILLSGAIYLLLVSFFIFRYGSWYGVKTEVITSWFLQKKYHLAIFKRN